MEPNWSPSGLRSIDVSSAIRARLVGRPLSSAAAATLAVAASFLVARRVAATGAYLRIEHALPTYDGSAGPLFFAFGGVLVGLAVLSAYADAGVLPTVLLAGAPVFGWAVNHASAPIGTRYAATFPLEMALLYGGVFGVVGYLLGSVVRTALPPSRLGSAVR
jgi:hypothetical protein